MDDLRDAADGLKENATAYDEIDSSMSDQMKRLFTPRGGEFDPATVLNEPLLG